MHIIHSLVLLALFCLTLPLQAQKLEFIGEIPKDLEKASLTLYFQGKKAKNFNQSLSGTFLAFKAAGFQVHVNGERRLGYGGQVSSATGIETDRKQAGMDITVSPIHENAPTELVANIRGKFRNAAVRGLSVSIIDRATGELLMLINTQKPNDAIMYNKLYQELSSILAPEGKRVLPKKALPRR
ncbi:MAG: hypothetical protein AB8F78_11120 [Saprospiraceae bacterium]